MAGRRPRSCENEPVLFQSGSPPAGQTHAGSGTSDLRTRPGTMLLNGLTLAQHQ